MPPPRRGWLLATLTLVAASACREDGPAPGPRFTESAPIQGAPTYVLAVHPLYNPARLTQAFQPLVDHLNYELPHTRIVLQASRDYPAFEARFRAREPELLLPNPWQALQAMKAGYHVIAMAGDPADFKGLIIVRRDSRTRVPTDLRGSAVAFPARTALAACVMPQWFLRQGGLDVNREIESRYVGSQESSIMNAYLKLTAAGATWPPPWRAFQRDHPKEAAELKVLWETEPLVNNAVMVRDDVPEEVARRLRAALVELVQTPRGQSVLAGMETARFLPATDADYEPVRRFVERFEREVRPVEGR